MEAHEMKQGSMAVISPLNATATVAAARDDDGKSCMMLAGKSDEIMTLVEQMAVTGLMMMYKQHIEENGEDEAIEKLAGFAKLFNKHIMERLLSETIKDIVKRECEGMPEGLAEIIAKGLERMASEDDDEEGDDD